MDEHGPEEPAWIDREPGGRELRDELSHLARRAAARPFATLGATLAATALCTLLAARAPRNYTSSITFRVSEGELDLRTAPPLNPQLRAHVADVLLSSPKLLAIARAHDLYPAERKRSDTDALEAFRADIGVSVWRNYFLEGRETQDDPARSARLSIRYRARDPELAHRVAKELARALIESEEAARTATAERALSVAREALEEVRQQLFAMRDLYTLDQIEQSHAPTAAGKVELLDEQQSVTALEELSAQRAKELAGLDLRLQLEKQKMGLHFDLVDGGRVADPGASRGARLAGVALLAFFLLLPIAGIAVGAFDRRIDGAPDVRRLGLHPLGHVPPFPGDRLGAQSARARRR